MDDYSSNMIPICCLFYVIYACLTPAINSPKIWFDKDGMHTKDRIPENKDFIAVTQVKVSDRNDKDLFRTHFLNVSTRHIEIILPAE